METEKVKMFINNINERWELHKPEDEGKQMVALCLAFVVDRRFAQEDGLEMRLAVSFGGNPFSRNAPRGFLPPPVRPGKFVFGIHVVGTKGKQIALYDQWFDARAAEECETAEEADAIANAILREISDSQYVMDVCSDPEEAGAVQESTNWPVEEFEVVSGESL